jgi:hypothetical protein
MVVAISDAETPEQVRQGRPSFLKKRSKKLLILRASASPEKLLLDSQKFFASFFQKRRP